MPEFWTETLPPPSNITMGTEGIEAEGEITISEHAATINEITRIARTRMLSRGGAPILSQEFHSPSNSINLLANGGFEVAGTLVDWTKTIETGGLWSQDTAIVYEGTSSAKWDPSADSNFGQMDYAVVPVTALNGYRLSARAYFETNITNLDGRQLNVLFYDDEIKTTLLATELMQWENISADAWIYGQVDTVAPEGAHFASVRVLFSHNGSAGGQGNCYVDDITLVEIDVDRAVQFLPDPTAKNGRWQFPNILSLRAADSGHLVLFARHHRPFMLTDNGSYIYFGGKHVDRTRIASSVAKTTVFTTIIRANSLGRRGTMFVYIFGATNQNVGAGRNLVYDVDFGGSNLFSASPGNIAISANDQMLFIEICLANNNLQELQYGDIRLNKSAAVAAGAFGAIATDSFGNFTGTVDTKSDQTLTVSVTPSHTDITSTFWGWARGPIEAG